MLFDILTLESCSLKLLLSLSDSDLLVDALLDALSILSLSALLPLWDVEFAERLADSESDVLFDALSDADSALRLPDSLSLWDVELAERLAASDSDLLVDAFADADAMLELLASLSLINCSLKVMLPASDLLMLSDTLVETDVKLLFTSLMLFLISVLLAVEPTSLVEALLESDSFISVEAALLAATLAENASAADCDLASLVDLYASDIYTL